MNGEDGFHLPHFVVYRNKEIKGENMIDKSKIIKVTNRYKGSVGYTIPDLNNLHRQYQDGETKDITFEELEKLSWLPGGEYIIKNCLIIHDPEAVEELMSTVEPEYYYTEEDVTKLLKYGSLDEFLDCLDFAPEGVLDMIKDLAVSLPLNDVQKRNAILDKLGFDVTTAIDLFTEPEDENKSDGKRRAAKPKAKEEENKTTERRVKVITPAK